MPSKVKTFVSQGLIKSVPSHVPENIQYEVFTGSHAYGTHTTESDFDVVGFSIPDKVIVFPHLQGEIDGFGPKAQRFEQWESNKGGGKKIIDPTTGKEWEFVIYSIAKYFDLCSNGNPNMIDTLFVPLQCITHMTPVGQMVHERRHLFLSKKIWHTFKGYAYSQLECIRKKNPPPQSKRREAFDKFGYDVKFAYHVVRLMNEAEQILEEGDLDLLRSKEQLKSVRRGEWTLEEIDRYQRENEARLMKLYDSSTLPHKPRIDEIRQLLIDCLEQHFGNLKNCVELVDPSIRAIGEIEQILLKYRSSGG